MLNANRTYGSPYLAGLRGRIAGSSETISPIETSVHVIPE